MEGAILIEQQVSQEFYDAISVVVCMKHIYNIFITLKYLAHRDVASFLFWKNAKFSKTQEAAKKYPAKLSSLENSSRKRSKEKKKESMKSSSKYWNTIEMEDEDISLNLQSLRKQTSSGFESD